MVEIREAPVPMRWRWVTPSDPPNPIWYGVDYLSPDAVVAGVDSYWSAKFKLSNGQTIIVRAKK